MTRAIAALLLSSCFALAISAQSPVLHGTVRRFDGHAPVAGALVRLQQAGGRATTTFNGGFSLALPASGDTLIVSAIGFLPDTVALSSRIADTVTILLRDAPLALSDLVASSSSGEPLASGQSQTWKVSGKALRTLPAMVEPDVNRMLALVPGVSFSSLLSARPMLRGLDADDASMTVDGFEAINLYHIGRFFSAVPGLAVDHADVRFQPTGADLGGTTAGQISIVGRSGTAPSSGDAQYGAGALSLAGGTASADGHTSVFATGRTVKTSLLEQVLDNEHVDYNFQDLYANVRAVSAGIPLIFSLFASSDHVAPDSSIAMPGDARMDWSNFILGVRGELLRTPSAGMTASIGFARHEETSDEIPARGTEVDVHNLLSTITAQLDAHTALGKGAVFRYGASAIDRNVENVITPLPGFDTFLATNTNEQRIETGGYGEVDFRRGGVDLTGGVRVDHAEGATVVQPRAAIRLSGKHDSWIELSAGRSARLFHLVSDSRSEPKYAYYDFWLPAGIDGTPAATMDQVSLGAARTMGRWQLRADLFSGWGDGEADLKPQLTSADSGNIFRYGKSRVRGADVSAVASAPDGRWSMGMSYAYTVSERNWGDGWVPWISDRRHEGRFFGTMRVISSVRLATSIAVSSPLPFTPILGWVVVPAPGFDFRQVTGPEMSARGVGWLRVDGTITKEFHGPWHSRWEAGFGISNLSVGDQAPRTDSLLIRRISGVALQPYISEKPLFTVPVVPTIVLRGQIGTPH